MTYSLGDVIVSKKKHPCGNDKWEIVRVGADYKIKCTLCQRVVMLTPSELNKIVKKTVSKEKNEQL